MSTDLGPEPRVGDGVIMIDAADFVCHRDTIGLMGEVASGLSKASDVHLPGYIINIPGWAGPRGHGCVFAPRHHFRVLRPPAKDEGWVRQETVPRKDFDRWLQAVREGAKIGETV